MSVSIYTPPGSVIVNPPGTPMMPVVSWPTPASIVYPTALSSTQLNASVGVPGAFAYTPPLGTVLSPDTNVLTVVFVPTDPILLASTATTIITVLPITEFCNIIVDLFDMGYEPEANIPIIVMTPT